MCGFFVYVQVDDWTRVFIPFVCFDQVDLPLDHHKDINVTGGISDEELRRADSF